MRRELNPDFEEELDRVYRGGSWSYSAQFARVAFRFRFDPARRHGILGLRLAHDTNHQQGEQHVQDSRT
jgi:hypothetical protein